MLRCPDKSVLSAQRVNIGANDDAARIYPCGTSQDSPGEVERRENALS